MRFVVAVLIGGGIVAGCATRKPGDPSGSAGQTATSSATRAKSASPTETAKPTVAPDDPLSGRVASVHPTLRFVVMDFPIRKMPALEQRLNIYRDGQKVGEVKVTGPVLDTTIAGDIVVGNAEIGDEVRED